MKYQDLFSLKNKNFRMSSTTNLLGALRVNCTAEKGTGRFLFVFFFFFFFFLYSDSENIYQS